LYERIGLVRNEEDKLLQLVTDLEWTIGVGERGSAEPMDGGGRKEANLLERVKGVEATVEELAERVGRVMKALGVEASCRDLVEGIDGVEAAIGTQCEEGSTLEHRVTCLEAEVF